jgi:hypothetical protein
MTRAVCCHWRSGHQAARTKLQNVAELRGREAEGTNMGEIDRKVNREILISKRMQEYR